MELTIKKEIEIRIADLKETLNEIKCEEDIVGSADWFCARTSIENAIRTLRKIKKEL